MDDKRKNHPDPKRPPKRNYPQQIQTIICLLMIWKLTAQIREGIYDSLISCGLFPEEQKGCCKWTRGTGELLYIDQHVLMDSKMRWKNLAIGWIDYIKAYDMVVQSWIINCLKMYKISVSHKVYQKYHGKLENWTDSRWKKLNWGENLVKDLPGRCAITITIHNSNDATQWHAQEMYRQIQTS